MNKTILIGVAALAILSACIILSPGEGNLPFVSFATPLSLTSSPSLAPLRPLPALAPQQQSPTASTVEDSPAILTLPSNTAAASTHAPASPFVASGASADRAPGQAISTIRPDFSQAIQSGGSAPNAPRDSRASQPAQSLATTSPAAVGPTPAPIIPGAFVTSAASTDPNIAPALATIRQNFTQAVQTNTSDPNSPQYATDWQTAQSLADDLLHERVGDVAFNQIEHDAAQASAAAAPPSPRH